MVEVESRMPPMSKCLLGSWLVNLPPPPNVPPPRNNGLIRPYSGKPLVNKPLIRPYFWGGYVRGGRLTSHDWICDEFSLLQTNIFAPENGWLAYDCFLLGKPIFRGKLLVSGSVYYTMRMENVKSDPKIVSLIFSGLIWFDVDESHGLK